MFYIEKIHIIFRLGLPIFGQCSPMAVGPSDISGNDWLGPMNSSPAADRMSDEISERISFFWPNFFFALGSRKK